MMFDWTFLKEKYISYIIFSIKKSLNMEYFTYKLKICIGNL